MVVPNPLPILQRSRGRQDPPILLQQKKVPLDRFRQNRLLRLRLFERKVVKLFFVHLVSRILSLESMHSFWLIGAHCFEFGKLLNVHNSVFWLGDGELHFIFYFGL